MFNCTTSVSAATANHIVYRVAQKSKPLPNYQKIVLNRRCGIRFLRHIKEMIKHYNVIRHSVSINILCVTYFLTSISMTDLQPGDMHQIQYVMSAIPLPSARLCKLWFPFLNHLIDGDLCKKNSFVSIFSLFFLVFNHDFVIYMDFFPCRSFQQNNWWRHKLGHTEY